MFSLSPELLKMAKENCNESSETRDKALAHLSLWLKKSTHLKVRPSRELLLSFFRVCCFNMEVAKKRLDTFYTMKAEFPEVLRHRRFDEPLMQLYRQGIHTIPENTITPNGPRLIISQLSRYDPLTITPKEIFKLLFMLIEILANEDANASVSGLVYIVDARDVNAATLKQYDKFLLKKIWEFVQTALPLKLRQMHVINMRKDGQDVFDFVKTFQTSKMPIKVKFHVHQKAEDLYTHIPRDAMTVEYGGHNGYQFEALHHWEIIIMNTYKDYFAQDNCFGIIEKVPITKSANLEVSQLTGLTGSFRKLTCD